MVRVGYVWVEWLERQKHWTQERRRIHFRGLSGGRGCCALLAAIQGCEKMIYMGPGENFKETRGRHGFMQGTRGAWSTQWVVSILGGG